MEETAAPPLDSAIQAGDEQVRVTDLVIDQYNQWITVLGPGLSAEDHLRVFELASQKVLEASVD